ncbi:hypothetical protein [Escherichia phage Lidtsur]|uniref:Uncharacterized protein n=1 Tax=Escherichia phage Lidtsur TaxID=2562235 RepID=A0A4D6DYZ9_9CAUD|nr:hypothetical protein HOV34_gp28 [Escherichia phage Lidtsur]QBZ71532.1 hypothetical protein [Escherichia phage Lidtsur]
MRELEEGEVIYYDDPRSMSIVIKSRNERVEMSYEMFFTLKRMFEQQVMERVDEQIKSLVVGGGGY